MAEIDNQNLNQNEAEGTFDTTGLILDFVSHWKWFLISVIICLGLGIFYISTKIPFYSVEASIYLNDPSTKGMNPFSIDTSDPLAGVKSFIDETELEVLKSRNNVIKIVDSLNLCYSYYKVGSLRNKPLYLNNAYTARLDSANLRGLSAPIRITVKMNGDSTYNVNVKTSFNKVKEEKELKNLTFPAQVETSHGTVYLSRNEIINDTDEELITIRSARTMAKILSSSMQIEFAKNSEKIIRIKFTTDVPARGVDIINALLDFYNNDIIAEKNRSAVQTEAFILDRLVNITDELQDVESRLQNFRQAHNITDLQMQSGINLNLQSTFQQQLADAEATMTILNEIERIVSTSNTYDLLPSAVQDPSISGIIEQYNNRVQALNRALEGSTANSPIVSTLQEELTRQKVRILQTLVAAKRNLNTRIANIQSLENRSQGQLSSTPTLDKGLQEIFREQQVKVNIYTFLLQRREEIALQKTLATNTARLIDDPVASGPVSPKKSIILAIAFLLGLAIPGALIFVRRTLFPRFSDQSELEHMTNVPIVGEICLVKKKDQKEHKDIVVGENVSTSVAELFRLMRNNINFAKRSEDNNVILVTSAVSGEGKTFVATNLALTFALAGYKVLVMGADIRRPAMAERFGLSNKSGLTTYLSGQEKDLNKLINVSDLNPNLFVLTAGPIPPNPNELLMSPNMEQLMDKVKKEYDYIFIDSAPIGLISDSYLIMKYADLQLFVTRANYSSRTSLKTLHNAVSSKKMPHAYIVVNGVEISGSSYRYRRYGSYGTYGKNKTYGFGYGDYNKK